MNPLNLTKTVTEILVSVGVGSIVGNAIKQTTPANAHIVKRISIGIGGFVLSSMISAKASKYATDQIDETVEKIKSFKKTEPKFDETKAN
jgi:hypothetical protein